MNLEMIASISSAAVLFAAIALRLNTLGAHTTGFSFWNGIEFFGGVVGLMGCVGVIGHWFLDNPEQIPADTLAFSGLAVFAVGASRGRLCQTIARLQGWDGGERRARQ